MARSRVLVIYKSGARVEIECDECSIRKSSGELVSISWGGATPRPLLTGIGEIAAIYDLGEVPSDA